MKWVNRENFFSRGKNGFLKCIKIIPENMTKKKFYRLTKSWIKVNANFKIQSHFFV